MFFKKAKDLLDILVGIVREEDREADLKPKDEEKDEEDWVFAAHYSSRNEEPACEINAAGISTDIEVEVCDPVLKAYAGVCSPMSDASYVLDPMTHLTMPAPKLRPPKGSAFGFLNPYSGSQNNEIYEFHENQKSEDSIVTPDGMTLVITD